MICFLPRSCLPTKPVVQTAYLHIMHALKHYAEEISPVLQIIYTVFPYLLTQEFYQLIG